MNQNGIEVGRTSPPHRTESVAEFHVLHDGVVDIPAELYRDQGVLRIALYGKSGGESWNYPLSDFLAAIGSGIRVLDQYYEARRAAEDMKSAD